MKHREVIPHPKPLTYTADGDPDITLDLYTDTGDAIMRDTGNPIAKRPGGSTTSPAGIYSSTSLGEAIFNSGSPWTYTVA